MNEYRGLHKLIDSFFDSRGNHLFFFPLVKGLAFVSIPTVKAVGLFVYILVL